MSEEAEGVGELWRMISQMSERAASAEGSREAYRMRSRTSNSGVCCGAREDDAVCREENECESQ